MRGVTGSGDVQRAGRVFRGIYARLNDRDGQRLFQDMMAARSLRPRLTLPKVGAYVLALTVHAVTLGLVAFALWMIVSTWFAPGMVIICAVILLVGFEVRPRIPNVPKNVLDRLRFPRLFGLADQVSAEMGTRPVAGILITPRFTAGVARTGLLRRPYLEIGLPLFMILDPQERVALLSHEMGHLVNGDPGRSLIIATALESLVTWAYLLVPGRGAPRARPASTFMLSGAIAQRFAEMASKIMMVFAGAVAWMMVHLSWRDSQRAEYLADHLAAEVAGSAGTAQMLRKLEYVDVFDGSVESAGIRSLTGAQMMDEFSADIAAHSVAFSGHTRQGNTSAAPRDRTHPATSSRIAFVQARPEAARMTLTYGDSQAIDAELAPFRDRIGSALVNGYRERTYGHA